MRINSLSTITPSVSSAQNNGNDRPHFGHVIKARFFEVLPDNTSVQVQDVGVMKKLCRRLSYHLCEPWKEKKNRINSLVDFVKKIDNEYAQIPLVRRIINTNRPKDHCFYLITGQDCTQLNDVAHTYQGCNKKSKIIENHWKLVRDNKRRIYNRKSDELSLGIYLKSKVDPKTKKERYFFTGIELKPEKFFCQ